MLLGSLLVGIAALTRVVWVERRAEVPLLRLGLLRARRLAGACVKVAMTSVVSSAVVVVGSLQLQRVRGYDPVAAGLAFPPVTLVGEIASFAGARLVRPLGDRLVAVAALLLRGYPSRAHRGRP